MRVSRVRVNVRVCEESKRAAGKLGGSFGVFGGWCQKHYYFDLTIARKMSKNTRKNPEKISEKWSKIGQKFVKNLRINRLKPA